MNTTSREKWSSWKFIIITIIILTFILSTILFLLIPHENVNEEIRGTIHIVNEENVLLLEEPKIEAKTITSIPKGSTILLTGRTYSFILESDFFESRYEVVFEGFIGWITESELGY